MGNIVVICNLTLDGVMQAPGHPDEDPRDGFTHGGWAAPYSADAMGRVMAERSGRAGSDAVRPPHLSAVRQLLAGPARQSLHRGAQQDRRSTWRRRPWRSLCPGSTRRCSPAIWATPYRGLKAAEPERDLIILGSGVLVGSLLSQQLIDEFILLFHPLVLGSGRRLFPDGGPGAEFRLTSAVGTTTGVVICSYRTGQ